MTERQVIIGMDQPSESGRFMTTLLMAVILLLLAAGIITLYGRKYSFINDTAYEHNVEETAITKTAP